MRASRRRLAERPFKVVVVAVLATLLAGAILLQVSLDSTTTTRAGWNQNLPFDSGRSILDILGGVRETLAAYFWTKTDVLHHEYYNGDITREQALYPYYWLITRLDPHYTMAYNFASWMLCRFGKVDQGFNLAIEGVRYNPYSALLWENLATTYFFFKKDPAKARDSILKAIELTGDEGDKVVWGNLLRLIDEVLAGRRKIPQVAPIKQAAGLDKMLDKYEQQHEHGDAR